MNTPHFAKVKDFINLQMPSGFPVRFGEYNTFNHITLLSLHLAYCHKLYCVCTEIPFFHLMAAKVTFANVNGHNEPVPHVSLRTEQRRVEPVPSYTPTGPESLATTEGGVVKQRHGRAGGSSVDPDDDHTPLTDPPADEGGER